MPGRPAVHDAVDVDGQHLARPVRGQQPDDRRARGAHPAHDDLAVGEPLADHAQRVAQRAEHDDRGAVLVVVEDRDVEHLAQPGLDLEAARRGDVLQVDAAVGRGEDLDGPDDLLGVLGVQAHRPGVDAREPLEQRRLALHHRHRGGRAEVAQPEHGRAVGHDRDGVALDRQTAGVGRVGRDGLADPGDAGGVGAGEVVAVAQADLRVHLQLAAEVQQERPVGHLAHPHARQRLQRRGDLRGVRLVAGVARDVDDEDAAAAPPRRRTR